MKIDANLLINAENTLIKKKDCIVGATGLYSAQTIDNRLAVETLRQLIAEEWERLNKK